MEIHLHRCRGCGAVLPCSLGCAGIPLVWCEPCADAWNERQEQGAAITANRQLAQKSKLAPEPGRGDWSD